MIEDYFTDKSVSDQILDSLVTRLKALAPLANWTNNRIIKTVGGIEDQDAATAVPFVFVYPAEEDDKTTPSRNSRILFTFDIAVGFDLPLPGIPIGESTVLSVVDAIKGHLLAQHLYDGSVPPVPLTQGIDGFQNVGYGSIPFDDGTSVGICVFSVTYAYSVKTITRKSSLPTT